MSKVKLGDVIDTCLGKMLDFEKNKGEYKPYLANVNVRWGEFDLSNLSLMKFQPNEDERYGIKKGDLIICEGGEPGRCAVWEEDIANMKIQKALHRVRPYDSLNVYYLYYWFLLSSKYNLLERNFTQTTIKHLTGQQLKELDIILPDIKIQESIANILQSLDKKIQNNKKIIAELESMAKVVYMHSFFRKTSNGKLKYIIIENKKSDIKVGDAKEMNGKYPFFTSGDSIYEYNNFLIDDRNCFLNTGGNADIKFYVGKASYSTDTWCISAKNNMSDYLYLFLSTIKIELNSKFFQGTGLKHLQKEMLKNREIYIPTSIEINNFNKIVVPVFNTISEKTRENKELEKLRDWLLPMLMNGQARVED